MKEKFYHVAFYADPVLKLRLSGKTYKAFSIMEALDLYISDPFTPSVEDIRYISDETTSHTHIENPNHVESFN